MKRNLKIIVKKIKGKCPAFKEGATFYIYNGYLLKSDILLCLHALSSLIPYYVALSRGVKPEDLGLGKNNKAYVQCLDPCENTGGGTVVFEIHIENSQ